MKGSSELTGPVPTIEQMTSGTPEGKQGIEPQSLLSREKIPKQTSIGQSGLEVANGRGANVRA